jgi:hypothetical protein
MSLVCGVAVATARGYPPSPLQTGGVSPATQNMPPPHASLSVPGSPQERHCPASELPTHAWFFPGHPPASPSAQPQCVAWHPLPGCPQKLVTPAVQVKHSTSNPTQSVQWPQLRVVGHSEGPAEQPAQVSTHLPLHVYAVGEQASFVLVSATTSAPESTAASGRPASGGTLVSSTASLPASPPATALPSELKLQACAPASDRAAASTAAPTKAMFRI